MSAENLSFVYQLTATLIGAGVGVLLAMLGAGKVEKWKRENELKEIKINTLKSILDELKDNQKGLHVYENQLTWNMKETKFEGNWGEATLSAFESSVNGGNFLLIDLELQGPISTTYHAFQIWNDFMKQVIYFPTYNFPQEQIDKQAENLLYRLTITRDDLLKKN